MIQENRNRIINEDYADYIINYRTSQEILQELPDATIHIMDNSFAIIYLPVTSAINSRINGLRQVKTPNLFGLTSEISLEASGVEELRNIPAFRLRGEGVLIGFVDTGINYTLPAFKKEDGTTKILSIWDQTIQSEAGYPFNSLFGTEYKAEQINQALASDNPFEIVPSTDENGHGTMLAAIAAGTDNEAEDFFGVAPDSDIVIVKLRQAKSYLRNFYSIPEDAVCFQENSIMWGVQYCIQIARQVNRPVVICLGIGTSQSAHDGTAPLCLKLSAAADFTGVGVVVGAGNEGNKRRHFSGVIDPAVGKVNVELNVAEDDEGFFFELWGSAPGIYSIDILSPSGEYIPRIVAGLEVRREISFIFERTVIFIEYQTVETQTGDQLILVNFKNASAGIWRFTVYGQGDLPGRFHIWLPMGNFISQDTYFIQSDIYTTIVTPGNAVVPITVTSYNPVTGTLNVAASRGYTRANIIKPELAAPGVNYLAPDLYGGYTTYTGSGVASAHTAGIAALMFEWGIVRGNQPSFDTQEIKKYLIRGAKRSSNLTYPNRDWGFGIIDIFNTFDVLRTII